MTMSLSTVFEVGLGLILVYYVLSLVVSKIVGEITKWTQLRARDLEEGLRDLLADSGKLEEFMQHSRIQNLQPKRLNFLSTSLTTYKVADIPASSFALTLLDVLAPGEKSDPMAELRSAIGDLPNGKAKDSLLSMINSGVQSLEDTRRLVEGWYDDAARNISLVFTQHARRIVIVIAAAITLLTGVDSVAIAQNLWEEPSRRAAVTAQTDQFIQEQPGSDIQSFLSSLEELNIPLLWNFNNLPDDVGGWGQKIAGLIITWVAISQGSSFWYDVLKKVRSGGATGAGTGAAQG
jgi:hypothetical protein